MLKSGLRIEAKQLEDAAHLRRYLPLASVVAWRILWATMLARVTPDLPCTVLLEQEEWEALSCAIRKQPTPPEQPPSLQQAVRWIARLGG
ncbi:MAG: IS4 family transposase [Dehalococcoidia bacterium]